MMTLTECSISEQAVQFRPETGLAGRAGWRFPRFAPSSHHLRTQCGQGAQPREVVGRHRQGEQLIHLGQAPHHHLADRADGLAPAEALLDALAPALAHRVAPVPSRAAIDRAAARSARVARHMGRDLHLPARLDEAARVVALVGADRHAHIRARDVAEQGRGHVALGIAIGRAGAHVDHQTVSVVGQHMPEVAQLRRSCAALAIQPALGVGRRGVRGVAALVAMPVLGRPTVVAAVLAPHALVAGPGLDQRSVDAEVLARQQALRGRHLDRGVEQFGDRIELDQTVAVLAEHGVVPHRVLDGQTHEPSEQQVVGNLLDELALAADAVQHLQQHRPHELLGRDARPAALHVGLVHRRELGIHLGQRLIQPGADRAQRMAGRHELVEPHRAEQGLVVAVGSSHPSSLNLSRRLPASSPIRARRASSSTAC